MNLYKAKWVIKEGLEHNMIIGKITAWNVANISRDLAQEGGIYFLYNVSFRLDT